MKTDYSSCINCKKTPLHACGYLENRRALIHFIPLDNIADIHHFTELNKRGYRRSGAFVYHPACPDCEQCIPLRIRTSAFSPGRSLKRLWKKNSSINVAPTRPGFNEERYALYKTYINTRHAHGDMFPPTREQFMDFLCEGSHWSTFFEFRNPSGELVAVTVADRMNDALALVYTFFHPDHAAKSPGTYSIFWMIEYARQQQLAWVYLGYWIKACKKMVYKSRFQPYEVLIGGKWVSSDSGRSC